MKDNIKLISGRNGNDHLEFQLKNYPIFDFTISKFKIESSEENLLNDLKINEKIIIGLTKGEYNKKINKTEPLNFKEKYLNYNSISVQQIRNSKNKNYISLEEYNKLNIRNNYIGIVIFSFFGLLFLFLAFGNLKAYLNPKKEFELE